MMKDYLKQRIIGQDHVFDVICSYVKIGEAGLTPENELRGAFFFCGPTGTGKTETAKALSDYLHIPLIRFDMSEYSDPESWLHDFAYKLNNTCKGIILLDEIEKGALKIMDYFLQILSEAKITIDRKEIDLHQYYVVMTSNIGSKNIMNEKNFVIAKNIVNQMIRGYFRPEFLGRFYRDCIICYRPLSYDDMKQIAEQKVRMEVERLNALNLQLSYDSASIVPYFVTGMRPEFGARPMVQTIRKDFSLALIQADKKTGSFTIRDGHIALL